ncbi:hypothetical protein mRhiFer1_008278 [Rhinolophus ferrumequinum]|uniref:Uncharacterized protein n=1 Tax=Rhinolophus ferrumequinum TaxID=59479 RepID=A0A7J7VR78_RHIFE|nr:hypothetical protein mRhiFer1_008278 [Rhinolophus ferrumequinum]
MKRFIQWLHPGVKWEQQENSQEKGSPVSSAGSRGPDKSTRALTGPTEGPKVMTGMGKFLQERLGRQMEQIRPVLKSAFPPQVKFGQAQQKAQVPAQAGPIQGHPFNSRAPSCKVTKSSQQAAGFAARALQVLDKSETRTDNSARRLRHLRSNSYTRSTSNPGPIGRLWPFQAPGKISASIRQMREKDRQAQIAATFKEQLLWQLHH